MIFEVPPICHAGRRWYESTAAAGKLGWAGRRGRTIGTEGFSRETCRAILRPVAEESKSRRTPSRVVTYETQDSHTRCPDGLDAGYVPAGGGGLSSALNLCSLLGCQVQGTLDGNVSQ